MFWWISFFSRWNWLDGSRANCKLSIIMNSSEVRGTSVKLPSKWNIRLMRLKKLMNTLVFGSHLKKKNFGYRLFGFGIFCPEVQSTFWQKRPKKIFGRFLGHPGYYFGQILGLEVWASVSFWFKCAPSIADQSLKVSNVSPQNNKHIWK